MTDLSPWAAQAATISDDQAQQMRLVIAGHAENTADAKLLMQAFGLLPATHGCLHHECGDLNPARSTT